MNSRNNRRGSQNAHSSQNDMRELHEEIYK